MTKKILLSILLTAVLTCTSSEAKVNTHQLAQLASKQAKLSKNITHNYLHKHISVQALFKELELGQAQLKSTIKTPEISNLLKYLNLCVLNLKKVVNKPYNADNALLVSDLGASLSEGNHYIAQSL